VPQHPPERKHWERHLILGDIHYHTYTTRVYDPDTDSFKTVIQTAHDPQAISAAEAFMDAWKPTHIHANGDILDAPQISRFDKGPLELDGLAEDIDGVRALLKRWRHRHPDAHMAYYMGNHEARLGHYLMMSAPALQYFKVLDFHNLLDARGTRFTIHPYKVRVPILPGVLEVTHGDKVSIKSGYTAHKMLTKNVSGVSGHVHRLGMIYNTTRTGTQVWAEGGCLCRLDPEYMMDPDWQHGLTIIWVDRAEGRFYMEQVPIIKGKAFYAGAVFSG
jgi:hypothetical protein